MGRRLLLAVLGIGVSLGVYFVWRGWQDPPEQDPSPIVEHVVSPAPVTAAAISEAELIQRQLAGAVALAPAQGFPGALSWYPLHDIGARRGVTLENLLHARPVAFLELCLERYEREVRGYTVTFIKKERIDGKLYPPGKNDYEEIKVAFREQPFSVFFDWKKHRRLAARALYVEGQNKNKLLARPFLTFMGIQERDLNDPEARKYGRYTMAEFGLGKATQRTVAAMHKAEARGALHVRYEGMVTLAEVGDRVCYKFVRTPYEPPEEEGVYELTLYIDCENWLQIGSILRDAEGHLIAEYFFRDIELIPPHPEFPPEQFDRKAL
jgi:hypothetical protein